MIFRVFWVFWSTWLYGCDLGVFFRGFWVCALSCCSGFTVGFRLWLGLLILVLGFGLTFVWVGFAICFCTVSALGAFCYFLVWNLGFANFGFA